METSKIRNLFTIDVMSRVASGVGDSIFYPVMITLAAMTANPAQAMLFVSLSEGIPILLGLFIGTAADSVNNKMKTMHILNISRFVLYGISAFLFFQNVMLAFYATIFINFISDCIGKGYTPIANAMLISYVPKEEMVEKQGILNSIQPMIGILAPLLGGVLMLYLNYGVLASFNAITFLAATALLLVAKTAFAEIEKRLPKTTEKLTPKQLVTNTKAGLDFLLAHKQVFILILITLIINMLLSSLPKITMPMHLLQLGIVEADKLGVTMSIALAIMAIGTIVGSLLAKKVEKFEVVDIFVFCVGICGICTIGLGFGTNIVFWAVILFILGFAMGILNTYFSALLMTTVQVDNIGTVTAFVTLLSGGGIILGDILTTGLLSFYTSGVIMSVTGSIVVLISLLTLVGKKKIQSFA